MQSKPEVHVYLAGPDVFFPNPIAIGESKKEYLASLKMVGHFPFDNEIPSEAFANPKVAAQMIADANEKMMLSCCGDGKIGVILANMIPFHGASMDVGTSHEIGFMSALSYIRKNVIIIGYTPDERKFVDRVVQDVYKGNVTEEKGRIIGADGNSVESFGGEENLMITGAIQRTGGKICKTFEEAALLGRELANKLIEKIVEKPVEGNKASVSWVERVANEPRDEKVVFVSQ